MVLTCGAQVTHIRKTLDAFIPWDYKKLFKRITISFECTQREMYWEKLCPVENANVLASKEKEGRIHKNL